ncbi:hypothetical protein KC717_01560 [Candidatus Dojkabacteria bacterium]|uniref:UTP--glucose-1-phosphate uridylyltransferase n=1 Tax=Candidatus Dojkabacteria bacterium TaxID=2099670 RepID=A0A955RJY7_9BACT|nr:hypothetical protein [Candidatus Dojkabacteria bacterium]
MSGITQAVITDAGVSSRFLPIVKSIPKSFIPLGNKPIIQILVEEALEAGLTDIIIVCREDMKSIFEDYFSNPRDDLKEFLVSMGKSDRFDSVSEVLSYPKITIITQDPTLPYGTAAPVLSAKPYLKPGEPFVFMQGDDVVIAHKRDCQILVETFEEYPDVSGIMMAEEITTDVVHKYGMIKTKGQGDDELDHVVEKPSAEDTPSLLASYGRFLYKYEIFDYMNAERTGKDNELWNVDALTAMAHDKTVKVVRNQGTWVTTGDPVNYLKAQILFGMHDGTTSEMIKDLVSNL